MTGPLPESAVLAAQPMIHGFARYISARAPYLREDLVSEGYLKLTECWQRYDGRRECSFLTYAEHRIRGAMLDWHKKWWHRSAEPLEDWIESDRWIAPENDLSPFRRTLTGEMVRAVRSACRTLPHRLERVTRQALTQDGVSLAGASRLSRELGVSAQRIYQLRTEAIAVLRRSLWNLR